MQVAVVLEHWWPTVAHQSSLQCKCADVQPIVRPINGQLSCPCCFQMLAFVNLCVFFCHLAHAVIVICWMKRKCCHHHRQTHWFNFTISGRRPVVTETLSFPLFLFVKWSSSMFLPPLPISSLPCSTRKQKVKSLSRWKLLSCARIIKTLHQFINSKIVFNFRKKIFL